MCTIAGRAAINCGILQSIVTNAGAGWRRLSRKGASAMALDKAIKYGKEKRKPYTGSKAVFGSCRNHGGCKWCEENRRHKFRDKHPAEKEEQMK